ERERRADLRKSGGALDYGAGRRRKPRLHFEPRTASGSRSAGSHKSRCQGDSIDGGGPLGHGHGRKRRVGAVEHHSWQGVAKSIGGAARNDRQFIWERRGTQAGGAAIARKARVASTGTGSLDDRALGTRRSHRKSSLVAAPEHPAWQGTRGIGSVLPEIPRVDSRRRP